MRGALEGLRVADFTHVIAGPFCSRLLADHGAEVVKVESRTGDVMRNLPMEYEHTLTSAFAQYNCGKRSVVLDLKATGGREAARRLCGWADVVVENFAAGTMERLGLGYPELRQVKRELIMCSVSSFGAVGPYADIPGFGLVAEAYSGLMYLAGDEGAPPSHFGTPLADMNVAVHAFGAICASLVRQARTGLGTWIDISSFDCLVSMIDEALPLHAFSHGLRQFGRYGTKHPTVVPSGVVRTSSGDYVAYGVVGDQRFGLFAEAMGRPELASDPRFVTSEDRVVNRSLMYDMVAEWALGFPDGESLVRHLSRFHLPAARVRSYTEIAEDPHLIARGALAPIDVGGSVGEVLIQTAPHRIEDALPRPRGVPPRLGEHSREVLTWLNFSEAEIDEMVAAGVTHEDRMTR